MLVFIKQIQKMIKICVSTFENLETKVPKKLFENLINNKLKIFEYLENLCQYNEIAKSLIDKDFYYLIPYQTTFTNNIASYKNINKLLNNLLNSLNYKHGFVVFMLYK
jgi:hypothetical protein